MVLAIVLGMGALGCSKSTKTTIQASSQQATSTKKEKSVGEKVFLRLDPGGHTSIIWSLFFFDHGTKLISASDDKTIRIWDVSDLKHPRLSKTIRGEIGRRPFGYIYAMALDPPSWSN